jgi:hypothetical protein
LTRAGKGPGQRTARHLRDGKDGRCNVAAVKLIAGAVAQLTFKGITRPPRFTLMVRSAGGKNAPISLPRQV